MPHFDVLGMGVVVGRSVGKLSGFLSFGRGFGFSLQQKWNSFWQGIRVTLLLGMILKK